MGGWVGGGGGLIRLEGLLSVIDIVRGLKD